MGCPGCGADLCVISDIMVLRKSRLTILCRISGRGPSGTNGTFSYIIYTFFPFFMMDFAQWPITLTGSPVSECVNIDF